MVERLLHKFVHENKLKILDYGAGYGAFAKTLNNLGVVDAIEKHAPCRDILLTRGYRTVYNSMTGVARKDNTYDLVTFFDVLEHLEDDVATLHFVQQQILEDSGLVFATVPAYQFLYSAHDVAAHHFRRYTKASILRAFNTAGLHVIYASYWNSMLFPLAALLRIIGRGGGESLQQPKLVDTALGWLLTIEARLMPYISLPFGLTLVIIARKESDSN